MHPCPFWKYILELAKNLKVLIYFSSFFVTKVFKLYYFRLYYYTVLHTVIHLRNFSDIEVSIWWVIITKGYNEAWREWKIFFFFTLQGNPGTEHNINSQNSDSWFYARLHSYYFLCYLLDICQYFLVF